MSPHTDTHHLDTTRGRDLPSIVVHPGTLEDYEILGPDHVDALAVGVGAPVDDDDELQPRAGVVHVSARYRINLSELAERARFRGAAGTTHIIDLPRVHTGSTTELPWDGLPLRIILVGVGHSEANDMAKAGAALGQATRGLHRVVTTVAATGNPNDARAFARGYLLAAPRPWSAKSRTQPGPADELVLLVPDHDVTETTEQLPAARTSAWATWFARDLTATPSNIKTPKWFADQLVTQAKNYDTVTVTVRDHTWLDKKKYGALLAVGQGSQHPPLLVEVTHTPQAKTRQHVAIVGKGITFDTGGISLKRPRETMIPMKTDMAGAASAAAAVFAAAQNNHPTKVTAILALAENHIGARSYRPGDILRTHRGSTIEITNTDAEGRLVLADALEHAVHTVKADLVIDIATLTGAASMGLGRDHGALYTEDPILAERMKAAGEAVGEPVWHMPLVTDYADDLQSDVADVANTSRTPGGGSITAALFLQRFVPQVPWIHLDIAGPARSDKARIDAPQGATGYGARLLTEFLHRHATSSSTQL